MTLPLIITVFGNSLTFSEGVDTEVPSYTNDIRYAGDPTYVPWEITRRRRSSLQMMRRMGEPILFKHRYSDLDVRSGLAIKDVIRDSRYGQTRNADPLSLGVGYTSSALSPNEWVDPHGVTIVSDTNPGAGYTPAPLYRGFDRGVLTYMIFPDVPRDYFAVDPGGPIMNVEVGQVISTWAPKVFDGDLLVKVTVNPQGHIVAANEVYECKKVMPVTMRGRDRRGKPEKPLDNNYINTSNRFIINQRFQADKLPENDIRVTSLQIDR